MFEITSVVRGGGYRYCRTSPPHPKANAKGYYPLHRVLAENKIGRLLSDGEVVHHEDGNRENDDPANLVVMQLAEHTRHHNKKAEIVAFTCRCGKPFQLKAHAARARLKQTNGATPSCSRSCAASSLNGLKHSYGNGCRCAECRAKHAAQQRKYRARYQMTQKQAR